MPRPAAEVAATLLQVINAGRSPSLATDVYQAMYEAADTIEQQAARIAALGEEPEVVVTDVRISEHREYVDIEFSPRIPAWPVEFSQHDRMELRCYYEEPREVSATVKAIFVSGRHNVSDGCRAAAAACSAMAMIAAKWERGDPPPVVGQVVWPPRGGEE